MSHLLRLPKFCGICERRLRLELRGRAGARTAYLTCTCWFIRQKTLPRPARLEWLAQEARKRPVTDRRRRRRGRRMPQWCTGCDSPIRIELRGSPGRRQAFLVCDGGCQSDCRGAFGKPDAQNLMPARARYLQDERAWHRLVDAARQRRAALRRNVGLVSTRNKLSHGPWAHVYATTEIVESAAIDQYDINALFPLYVYPQPTQQERRDGQMDLEFPAGSEGQDAEGAA